MKSVSKGLVAASARPLVLSILSGGESYGYAILQSVRDVSGGDLEWSEGMLYPLLHKLESERLVTCRWRVSEQGRRRKYYRVTARGKRALDESRREWRIVHSTLEQAWGFSHA